MLLKPNTCKGTCCRVGTSSLGRENMRMSTFALHSSCGSVRQLGAEGGWKDVEGLDLASTALLPLCILQGPLPSRHQYWYVSREAAQGHHLTLGLSSASGGSLSSSSSAFAFSKERKSLAFLTRKADGGLSALWSLHRVARGVGVGGWVPVHSPLSQPGPPCRTSPFQGSCAHPLLDPSTPSSPGLQRGRQD